MNQGQNKANKASRGGSIKPLHTLSLSTRNFRRKTKSLCSNHEDIAKAIFIIYQNVKDNHKMLDTTYRVYYNNK